MFLRLPYSTLNTGQETQSPNHNAGFGSTVAVKIPPGYFLMWIVCIFPFELQSTGLDSL